MFGYALISSMLVLLMATPAAAGARPWSLPVDVGPPADYTMAPGLAFAHDGSGLVTWQRREQPAQAGGLPGAFSVDLQAPNDAISSRALRLGVPGAGVQSLADSIEAGPVFEDLGRGLVLRTLRLSADGYGGRRTRLSWSAISRDGRIGRARTITTATLDSAPSLAEDHRGNAVAAWSERLAPANGREVFGRYRIRAAWRPAGKVFGAPVTLYTTDGAPSTRNGAVQATIGRRGRAVVAFADVRLRRGRDRKRVLVWTRTPRRAFGSALPVGPQSDAADIALGVTDRGRVIVVWGTQDGGEEATTPWIVRAATLRPRGKRFSSPQTLDRGVGNARPMGGVALAVDPGGQATVAWSTVRRPLAYPLLTATSDANGHFGVSQQVTAMGALGGLAVRQDGAAIVAYARVLGEQVTDQAYATVRPRDATLFGAPEAIADADHAQPPVVAFDARSGRPTVAWSARPHGQDPSNGIATTAILRLATRAAP